MDAVIELRQQGTTILFSTHDMEVAEKMCDFICMVFRGRKVLDGTLESIQGEYGSDVIRVRVDGDNNASKFGPSFSGRESSRIMGRNRIETISRDGPTTVKAGHRPVKKLHSSLHRMAGSADVIHHPLVRL